MTRGEGEQIALPSARVDRFRILRELGRGGMATVYEAEDTSTGQRLALKRLEHESSADTDYLSQSFEREFYNLAHFAHPCVVQVHDFGRDALGRPYYTMELLDGGDLRRLSPLPFDRTCALLVDICSVLSFLHSRRLVHRDVTPRNIRCTRDGKAKLIDFGTLMVVGPAKRLVGTAPYCPPEVLRGEDVDPRADLFALGATAYLTLTGLHPYPARDFSELREIWLRPVQPPSVMAKTIPAALDRLVMELLQLDRSKRPASAAEVMERLCAIAGLDMHEQQVVQQAYLSMPSVVGRDSALLCTRTLIQHGVRGRGGALLVSGAAGMGRSRLLAAAALEGKLLGLGVLRVDASDAADGAFSATRALLEQLLELAPNLPRAITTEQRELLGHLLPALSRNPETNTPRENGTVAPAHRRRRLLALDMRTRLQEAVTASIAVVSRQRALLLTVDDSHRLDEPSAALVALLVERTRFEQLVVIVSADNQALLRPSDSLRFVASAAPRLELSGLSFADTHALLDSMFGDVPNLNSLATHLHAISAGAPGVILQLAQHLLDTGKLRYEAGAWVLPAEIAAHELPGSLSEALAIKVDRLSSGSRVVMQVLASMPERAHSEQELLELSALESRAALLRSLDELVVADLVRTDRGYCRLAHASLAGVMHAHVDPATTRNLHLRWAALFERRAGAEFLAVDQLVRAGELERALESLLPLASETERMPVENVVVVVRTLPSDWIAVLQALVKHATDSGRPRRERCVIQALIVGLSAVTPTPPTADLYAVLEQAYHDCGLDIYDSLLASPEPERLKLALERAQQRYDAAPEAERVAPPILAIPHLAQSIVRAIGILSSGYDSVIRDRVPSIAPLAPLSPALEHIQRNLQNTHAMMIGRHHQARAGFLTMIERIDQPDRAGFDPLHHRFIRLAVQYGLGALELQYGTPAALMWADSIDSEPLFEINACRIRMLCALVAGDAQRADQYRQRGELLRMQNGQPPLVERRSLVTECACYGFAEDLPRLKQVLPEIEAMTCCSSGWQPVLHWAQGLYRQLRAEHAQALLEFETGLAAAAAGEHGIHLFLVAGYVEALCALGQLDQACEQGEQRLVTAEAKDLGPLLHRLLEALARAHSLNGNHARARELAGEAIARLEGFGACGLVMGGAYETGARVAWAAGLEQEFHLYAGRCAEYYKPEQQPMLAKRYEALMLATEQLRSSHAPQADDPSTQREASGSASDADCATTAQRADRGLKTQRVLRALKATAEAAAAVGGYLYALQADGPHLHAQLGSQPVPVDLDTQVLQFVSGLTQATLGPPNAAEPDAAASCLAADGGRYYLVLLAHEAASGKVINGVLALRSPDGRPLQPRSELCATISRALDESYDAETVLAEA